MKHWQSVLLSPSTSLQEAIAVLDKEGLRIILVVDDHDHLLGTITDGDIRRALLKHLPLSTVLDEIMNSSPLVAERSWSRERMLSVMEKSQLLQLPIVDLERKVVGLETLHGLLHRKLKENPVFLMAGGFGTRLHPLTHTCPKPLLKVGDKPILELIMQGFINAGFYRFYISTHYMPEMIRDYFGNGSSWGVEINYVHEETPLGTGGALGLLPHEEIDQPLFMMNGDLLTNLDFENLLNFHEEHQGVATMCVREHEYQVPYGVIQSDGNKVISMVEKPVHSFFINAGIYLLSPELVKSVGSGIKIDMPTILEDAINKDQLVNMFPIHEYWLDIGRMEDFHKAQSEVGGILNV